LRPIGWDADLIIWDSHPLSLGATPTQVFIDGIPQLEAPVIVHKPEAFQHAPDVPNFDREAQEALEYEGLPPLTPNATDAGTVVFVNVKSITLPSADGPQEVFATVDAQLGTAVVVRGALACYGVCVAADTVGARVVDLRGGSIAPGLTTFGSELGLSEIRGEPSTRDGAVFEPLLGNPPEAAAGFVHAADGLRFAGRDTLYVAFFSPSVMTLSTPIDRLAYRAGVTKAVAVPLGFAFTKGIGAFFSTGAAHRLEAAAIIQRATALHVQIGAFGVPSVSTQVAALRKTLLTLPADTDGEVAETVVRVRRVRRALRAREIVVGN
jgi:hypothetical protein